MARILQVATLHRTFGDIRSENVDTLHIIISFVTSHGPNLRVYNDRVRCDMQHHFYLKTSIFSRSPQLF